MSFFGWIKGVIHRMFSDDAKSKFGVEPIVTSAMDAAVVRWMNTYAGTPDWIDPDKAGSDENIKTINFAKAVCVETARLTTMATGIHISGSPRADWLQEQINKAIYPRLRSWVEYACAAGTLILKPNGQGVDVVTPDRFMVTAQDSNKKITGIIFQDTYNVGKEWYTKLEYHRFEKHRQIAEDTDREVNIYRISTKTFLSATKTTIGHEVPIDSTKWAGIAPEVSIAKQNDERLDSMLFGVFTMPEANNIDFDSPLGMSIFSGAMEELRDLDVAYSRNAWEIDNSNTIELVDDALLVTEGKNRFQRARKLPSYVHNVFGNDAGDFYQHIERPLRTADRKIGINQALSFIGYKCGFSNGYFVFDEKSGMVTATQVESDDRRTIQLIKDIRDSLQNAIDDTVYAMSVFADLYSLAPVGSYTINYDFGDITYNQEEDRNRWYQMMRDGVVPAWMYLVKFEGFSEEEAKQIQADREEKQASEARLFMGA